jgi:hypothetical protein
MYHRSQLWLVGCGVPIEEARKIPATDAQLIRAKQALSVICCSQQQHLGTAPDAKDPGVDVSPIPHRFLVTPSAGRGKAAGRGCSMVYTLPHSQLAISLQSWTRRPSSSQASSHKLRCLPPSLQEGRPHDQAEAFELRSVDGCLRPPQAANARTTATELHHPQGQRRRLPRRDNAQAPETTPSGYLKMRGPTARGAQPRERRTAALARVGQWEVVLTAIL